MTSIRLALLSLCLAATAQAQTSLPWAFESSRPVSKSWEVYHGETVTLAPTLLVSGIAATYPTNATARLYYQTNGMASVWWSTPAVVTTNAVAATWSGDLDIGASAYSFFIKITDPDGAINYRANGSLKMMDSPGFVPNAITQPVSTIDFSAVTVINEPWATAADIAEATAGLILDEQDTNALAAVSALSNYVDSATSAEPLLRAAGDTAGSNYVDSATSAEALLRAAGDSATSNYVDSAIGSIVEGDPVALAALSNLTVTAEGGYASEIFWYPTAVNAPAQIGTNVVLDDIMILLASGQSRIDKRLAVAVDERPTVYEIEPPSGTWTLEPGSETIAVLSNDVLVAQGGVGLARAIFTTDAGEAKSVDVGFAQPATGTVIKNPSAEIEGSWRAGVSTNVIAHFAAADTNIVSTYRYHRETAFGPNGVSTWTFPNSLQLYETGGTNSNAHDPRVANASFFWPEVADALRCVSSWRGDLYAHRPYIAVAPHYAISVVHWRQTNTWIPWCVDRDTDTWMTNRLAVTSNDDPGRVGSVADVSVHRFNDAFPTNILMRFLPQSHLETLSPSLLNSAIGMTASSHNTVHPAQLKPDNMPNSLQAHSAWTSYEVVWDHTRWLQREYGGVETLTHNTHLWDSGHLSFIWINGILVPVGTFTFANGGGNALLNDYIINRISEIVQADSAGAETVGIISTEELQ